VGLAGTGLAVRIWLEFSDDLAQKLNMLLGHLKNDARQLSQTAAEISEVVAKTGVDAEAETMIEEIHLALQHLDASGESVAAMIEAIDQIAFAANLLIANAAIQSSSSPNAADDLRSLADRCGKAARTTKAEIEQSRAELEKGNHEVAQSSTLLLRQSETLLQLAEGIDQTVEVIAANLGVGPSETAPGSFN
jgi:methyl-accepting chemotaxis protein